MAFNLLDIVKDQIGDQLSGHASSLLGEDESLVSKAMGGIVPSLLGSLVNKGATEEGASSIFEMLMDHDGGILDNVGELFGGGDEVVSNLTNSGSGILGSLLGDKLGGIVDLIASVSGLKKSSSSSLLSMAAPFVMGVIGRYVRRNGLNVSGLMDMFKGQKANIDEALPAGFSSLMGLGGLGDVAKNVIDSAADKGSEVLQGASNIVEETADRGAKVVSKGAEMGKNAIAGTADVTGDVIEGGKKAGSSVMKWIIPLIILLGALFLLTKYTSCGEKADDAMETIGNTTDQAIEGTKDLAASGVEGVNAVAEEVGDAIENVAGAISNISLPGGKELKVAAGSFTDKIVKFLSTKGGDMNTAFTFDGVSFETGSANVTADSKVQLNNLATVMNSYPTMSIRVEGHTDNTGNADSNKALSLARADAVKKIVTEMGIAADRITTVGYGQEKPIADNSTDEGRISNRRVDVIILGK